MTLNLFLRESPGSHSLHRPGWAIVEARPGSAQYHAAKTRVKLSWTSPWSCGPQGR